MFLAGWILFNAHCLAGRNAKVLLCHERNLPKEQREKAKKMGKNFLTMHATAVLDINLSRVPAYKQEIENERLQRYEFPLSSIKVPF